MKKILFFTAVFLFLAGLGWGQTYTWNGDEDNDWENPDNWDGGDLPGDGDPSYIIIIQPSANDPFFSGSTGLECDILTIESDASLDMDTFDLTVTNTLENGGVLKMTGDLNVGSLVNNGSLNAASINVAGTSNLQGDVTTTGNQAYNGTVTLGGAGIRVLTSTNGNISIIQTGDFSIGSLHTNTSGNISINTTGKVTQTGTVTTGSLTVNAGTGITLTQAANKVTSVDLSCTTGNIDFTNDLGSAGVLNVKANTAGNVTITEETGALEVDDISSGVNITLTAKTNIETKEIKVSGIISLDAGGNITIGGDITANQLLAEAVGNVNVGVFKIEAKSAGNENTSAAIYIKADNFIVPAGAEIIPGDKTGAQWGQLCLDLNHHWKNDKGVIDGQEDIFPDNLSPTGFLWHQHFIDLSMDLVYGDGTEPAGLTPDTFVKVGNSNSKKSFTLTGGGKIYIYNAEITPQNNTGLTFETSGAIIFYGKNEFSGISLKAGSGGVELIDTEIKVTGDFELNNNEKLTLDTNPDLNIGKSGIEAANIILNDITAENKENLTLKANSAAGEINLKGAIGTSLKLVGDITVVNANNVNLSGVAEANSIDVTSTGITIGADINTTDAQTYTGAVTIGGAGAVRILTGTNVTLGTITGGGKSLTINGNGNLSGGSGIDALTVTKNFTLTGSTLSAGSINANTSSGTSIISADITTTGMQDYQGAVTLSGTGKLYTLYGTTITLGEITGNSNSLTITGNGVLNGGNGIGDLLVSGTFSLSNNSLSAKSVNAAGASGISADIITTGAQTYTGAVTLGDDVEFRSSTGSNVRFSGTVNGTGSARDLTITNANVLFNSTIGSTALIKNINVTAGTAAINADITTTGDQTYTGAVTLTGSGTRTLAGIKVTLGHFTGPGAGLSLTINGEGELNGGNGINALSVSGDAAINADITTAGNQSYTGDVTLGVGKITLTAGTAGNITASSSIIGANFTINAGVNISLADIKGGTVELNAGYPDHTVFGNPGTITLADIDVTNLTIWCHEVTSSGLTNKAAGNFEIYTDDYIGTGAAFLGSFTAISNPINDMRPRSYEFGPGPGNPNYILIDSTDENNWASPIIINDHVYIYITGAITVPALAAGDLTIKTEFGNIVFNGTYDAAGHNLTLETTSGKIQQPAASSKITVDTLTITSGGTVTLAQNNEVQNLTVLSPTGNVDFKNNRDLEISIINAGANAVNLTVNGDIDLSGNINASSVKMEADSITGSGAVTASTGDISFINSGTGANDVSLERFNAVNGNIIVSTNAKDIVYYSSAAPATPPSGGAWTTPLFVEANSVYNGNVILRTHGASNNIYLADVIDSSQKTLTADCSAGTVTNGFIEFFTTGTNSYAYSGANVNHLDLLPGAGGIRIEKAVVDISGDFKINNANNKLTLSGSDVSVIKAANIILGDINATANTIELEAGKDITISGNVTAYQLTAKAPTGIVSVNTITIDSTNTGNEGEIAAIYIKADDFIVTSATPNSIIPGGKGTQWGQLCLELNKKWANINNVVDGPEDMDPDNLLATGFRWHQHFVDLTNTHLVYGKQPLSLPETPCVFISEKNLRTTFILTPGFNIYINNAVNNTSVLTFKTSETGFIEFIGNNEFEKIILESGSGGIRLVDADIKITESFELTHNEKITLAENSPSGTNINVIEAANITLYGITSDNNQEITLTSSGDIVINGNVNAESLDVICAGVININADITTNTDQTYSGQVELGGAGNRILSGAAVTLGAITGNAHSLSITGNGILNGASGINDFTVSGTADVKADIATAGNQTYTGAVTLSGTDIKISSQNGNIEFMSTLSNTAGVIDLSAERGNITVSRKVTAYQLIVNASGTVTVYEIEINSANTGNEGDAAAIYIVADTFVVTTMTANSIIPGGRPTGAQWGQLCLVLRNKWTDENNVVDGPEDGDPPGSVPGARWHQHISVIIVGKIIYSFTEDSNGNGKLDRIRVQTNTALNGDFTGFDVSITGYEIDKTKGNITKGAGFDLVSALTGKTPFDDDSFYIYLKENPEINGGNTPLWSILGNTSLKDKKAVPESVGDPSVDKNIKPIDTIPPRIDYTLTLPGHQQAFMLVSEPVASSSGADISATFGGLSVQSVNKVDQAGLGYLFNLSGSLKIEDLAKNIDSSTLVNGYFQLENIFDKETKPDWNAVDSSFPPKYPLNWGYTEYAQVTGDTSPAQIANGTVLFSDVFTPPNKLLTVDMMRNLANNQGNLVKPNNAPVIRRVTDVLVSIAPTGINSDYYFAWPVWARFKKSLNAPYTNGNDIFWGQQSTDTGIIWQFDGTNYLETNFIDTNDGIELQARINNNLLESPALYWTTSNIPAEYRNPKEATEAKNTGGLWLPNVFSPLYNYVPLSDDTRINRETADSSSSKLFNYVISADKLTVDSGAKFEFIFRLSDSSDMFIARLDIPRGAEIPANWYTLIRPFAFDIRNIQRQRGGVTVLNNVINSDNRETAFIRYHLARPGRVTVQVYTLDGTLVKSLRRNEQRDAGEWTDSWDGTNNGGRAVARGMYFVRVVGPDIDEIRKIMVVK
jgi:fibronectin-binding autotransporter adhesin